LANENVKKLNVHNKTVKYGVNKNVVQFDHPFLNEIKNFQKLNKRENSRSKKCEVLLEVSHSWCLA
jgi:hypothetical protein